MSKLSERFIFTSKESEFTRHLKRPIILDKDSNYELGLLWFSCYNTIFNITDKNNKFKINDQDKSITPGAYEVRNLSNELERYGIELLANTNTSKCILKRIKYVNGDPTYIKIDNVIKPERLDVINPKQPTHYYIKNSKLEFSSTSFFCNILGFDNSQFTNVEQEVTSINIINIIDLTSINICCNIIKGGYFDIEEENILYSFPINSVPFGYKILKEPFQVIYSSVNTDIIQDLKFYIIDDFFKPINFNGETITICVHLRQV